MIIKKTNFKPYYDFYHLMIHDPYNKIQYKVNYNLKYRSIYQNFHTIVLNRIIKTNIND